MSSLHLVVVCSVQGSPNVLVRGPHELSHSSPMAGHLT